MTTWHENQLRSEGESSSVRVVIDNSIKRFALGSRTIGIGSPKSRSLTYIRANSAK